MVEREIVALEVPVQIGTATPTISFRNRVEKYRERNREYIENYLREHPCVDCGEKNIRLLHFDHVRGPKVKEVKSMIAWTCAIKKIAAEIAKCEIRCVICHAKRHQEYPNIELPEDFARQYLEHMKKYGVAA